MKILQTDRLILREMQLSDADTLLAYRSDKDLCRFQNFHLETIEETIEFIEQQKKVPFFQSSDWKQISIMLNDGTLIGDCAIQFKSHGQRIAELGCTLLRKYHNKGYATEALTGLIAHCINLYNTHKFVAEVDIRNTPSQRMIEKIGFKREGLFKRHYWDAIDQDWFDELHYGLLAEDLK